MARKKKMHSVGVSMQVAELTKNGSAITLEVKSGDSRLGTLWIGRGSVEWKGRDRKVSKRLPWYDFAKHMEKLY